jgi:hypothetical protein
VVRPTTSALQLLGHRYYDPSTGRFLTRDPIKDGRNWYGYCENNPVTRTDANGLDWHDPSHVSVDKEFDGKVWVVGEPGPGKSQIMVPVKAGESSPEGMDVDYVIVQYKDGSQRRFFVSGTNPPQDRRTIHSHYSVNSKGDLSCLDPLIIYVSGGSGGGYAGMFAPAIPITIGDPTEFNPSDRKPGSHYPPGRFGGGPTGNWNDDIDAAKRRRGSRSK